jgi:eukaryotic-like serine/threonine-protein kinase
MREPSEDDLRDMAAVLHGEEVQRARVFFRIIFALATLTAAAIPALTGERWLRALSILSCSLTAVVCAVMLVLLRRPKNYTRNLSTFVGGLFGLMGVVVIYYIGLFSAGAMILVVGIYFFGLSHHRSTARLTYGTVSVLYLIASAGVASGLLADRALFSTENAVPFSRWFQVVMSQLIFAFTFYLARSSRRVTEGAIESVRKANVQIQKRDALLMEAQGELAQVRRPGIGRHTGTRIDGFRVGEVIGRGAMGEVYKGVDPAGLPVAIKMLHPNLVDDARKVKRFMKEAEVAAAVDSPHVPRVYGSGWAEDDTPFLAMDLLEGHDLSWHLRKTGKLQVSLVVEMVSQVAKALADVRQAGVVHRDLKPGNIYLVDSLPRSWKVLDFGLSKLMWDTGSLTKDHAVGTPAYMAPEQVMGPKVDHVADLYALAAIAYRALTGVPPFSGSEVGHVLYRVCYHQPTSPADLVSLPVDMELVLAIGLAKDRDRRFGKVEELAEAMRAAHEGRLDDETRARGWAVLKERPWGSKKRPAA